MWTRYYPGIPEKGVLKREIDRIGSWGVYYNYRGELTTIGTMHVTYHAGTDKILWIGGMPVRCDQSGRIQYVGDMYVAYDGDGLMTRIGNNVVSYRYIFAPKKPKPIVVPDREVRSGYQSKGSSPYQQWSKFGAQSSAKPQSSSLDCDFTKCCTIL